MDLFSSTYLEYPLRPVGMPGNPFFCKTRTGKNSWKYCSIQKQDITGCAMDGMYDLMLTGLEEEYWPDI